MKRLGSILLILIIANLVTGCGEAFRGQNSFSSSESEFFDDNGSRRSSTALSIDEQIMMSYWNELAGREDQTRSLTNAIRAFDFVLTPGASVDELQLNARITFDCEKRFEFRRNISAREFQTGQKISLQREVSNQSHSVRVQCTSATCQEIVAAISLSDNFNNATVLFGMAAQPRVENSVVYAGRGVLYAPYFSQFRSGADYNKTYNCPASTSQLSFMDRILGLALNKAADVVGDSLKEGLKEVEDYLKDIFNI